MIYGPTQALFYGSDEAVDLLAVKASDINFERIADSLAHMPRFLARTREPYFVAQHSVYVMDDVPRAAQPWALLHDAHEAFIGDDIRPKIKSLDKTLQEIRRRQRRRSGPADFSEALKVITGSIDALIYEAAGLGPPSEDVLEAIRVADTRAADVELRALVKGERFPGAPLPVSAQRAKADFLAALRIVCPNARGLS